MTAEKPVDEKKVEPTEEQLNAADQYYNDLKNSGELQAREAHRALMAELNGYYW